MPDDPIPAGIDPATGLAYLREELAALRGIIAAVPDLGLAVPACPGWDLRALVAHLGELHRWVRGAIVEGHPNTAPPAVPADRAGLSAWFDEGADDLLDLLAATHPDTPCWTFGPHPRTARFWFRRQAHEHAIHLHDARVSTASSVLIDPVPIDPVLAADGIDEVVTVFFPRQVRLGRIAPLERSLGVRASEAPGREWVIASDGTTTADAEAVVSGPAEALYLLLWGRVTLDDPRLTVDGAVDAARAVLRTAIVP